MQLQFVSSVGSWNDSLVNWFEENPDIASAVYFIIVLIVGFIAYFIAKHYLLKAFKKLASKTKTQIDDILIEKLGVTKILYVIPVVMLYTFAHLFGEGETIRVRYEEEVMRVSMVFISLIVLMSIGVFLNAVDEIYRTLKISKRIPIKTHLQIIKILIYLIGFVSILGQITGHSPWYFITGVGVFTAVLLMIFKDTILSFVASLQIASNDLFREGDWIEVPSFGADGDVMDISLHSVKVQNWDKTITVIPTNKFLEVPFKNWRGMQHSGGRRIKRSIHIDISSVRFCDEEMLQRFRKVHYIAGYIDRKIEDVQQHNTELQVDLSTMANGRHLTNIGTFRAYIEFYLRNHPSIHQEMTFLIRQLEPGPDGLPIQIYVFSNDTRWVHYEGIQSDIFDHLLSVIPEFDLKVYQSPAGTDLLQLSESQPDGVGSVRGARERNGVVAAAAAQR